MVPRIEIAGNTAHAEEGDKEIEYVPTTDPATSGIIVHIADTIANPDSEFSV